MLYQYHSQSQDYLRNSATVPHCTNTVSTRLDRSLLRRLEINRFTNIAPSLSQDQLALLLHRSTTVGSLTTVFTYCFLPLSGTMVGGVHSVQFGLSIAFGVIIRTRINSANS
ncbi:hypothetical protein BD309DRAFT_303582 [Dichomitus squalens]|nr:hypothetical protein BD309DRAFT_303582 [Dichomitus squalens]